MVRPSIRARTRAPSGCPPRRPTPTTTATAPGAVAFGQPGPRSSPWPRRWASTTAPPWRSSSPGCLNGFSDEEVDLMATLSLLANRPVNWNVLGVSAMNPGGL